MSRHLNPADLSRVRITGGFWGRWQQTNRTTTIPYVLDKCDETGRTQTLKQEWSPDADRQPHQFYDSDIAKSLEAAAYALQIDPDPKLEARVEEYVKLFAAVQLPDGYLNSYYTLTGLDDRWTNLRDMHELYCAGHLFEAAVAHFEATGRRSFLDVAVKLADHIDARFGPADEPSPNGGTKAPGYPGHEEVELALVKLAHAADEPRYLGLARFFIDERGREPNFFRAETARRGDREPTHGWGSSDRPAPFAYYQAHLPVRDQRDAEGHSVRACYLYSGMVDVAAETGDDALLDACRTLFGSIVDRRMYVTGGIGSHKAGERFTFDYDLPNESAYTETCASIALVFFASRLLNAELRGRYGDVMERALYNGALGGLSLDGTRFFYSNPLTYHDTAAQLPQVRADAERRPWYGCACCPPNIARLLASLGAYMYSATDDGRGDEGQTPLIAVHLYGASSFEASFAGAAVRIRQETDYPWDGAVRVVFETDTPAEVTLALRIPSWAEGWELSVEGGGRPDVRDGYARVTRRWQAGDAVRLALPMPIRRTRATAAVRNDGWRVALERGPIVYCLEECDNGANLASIAIPRDAELQAEYRSDALGGAVIVTGTALRRETPRDANGDASALYSQTILERKTAFTAVPFALRANRGAGEMRVWIAEIPTTGPAIR